MWTDHELVCNDGIRESCPPDYQELGNISVVGRISLMKQITLCHLLHPLCFSRDGNTIPVAITDNKGEPGWAGNGHSRCRSKVTSSQISPWTWSVSWYFLVVQIFRIATARRSESETARMRVHILRIHPYTGARDRNIQSRNTSTHTTIPHSNSTFVPSSLISRNTPTKNSG